MTDTNDAVLGASPESRSVLALARDWITLAKGEGLLGTSEVLRFTAIWIAFNALYSLSSPTGGDRRRAEVFAERPDVQGLHLNLLPDADYSAAIATLAERGIGNHWQSEVVEITDRTSARQVVVACYVVRGNLVHGHKSPYVRRDRDLVGAAYGVVLPIVSHFTGHDA